MGEGPTEHVNYTLPSWLWVPYCKSKAIFAELVSETRCKKKKTPSRSMDELQKKLSQRHDARSRKVRFKISSAYSGRVLKQVYEDGQELETPQAEYPHSFRHWNFEPKDHLFGMDEAAGSGFCPPTKLNAQRISVFREGNKYTLTSSPSLLNDDPPEDSYMVSNAFSWLWWLQIPFFKVNVHVSFCLVGYLSSLVYITFAR